MTDKLRASPGTVAVPFPWRRAERLTRLSTGLVLFTYTTMHFVNHAFGIRSLEAMRAIAPYLLAPWQTAPGLILLYGAMSIHGALGLYAFYRRRHLRMPKGEVVQLALGLAIPLLLMAHAGAVRIGTSVYGLRIGYERVIYQYWLVSPDFALPRQMLLLVVVWIHGCLGIRGWLRSKPWYPRALPALSALALLIPVLAVLGFTNAGLDMRDAEALHPVLPADRSDLPGSAIEAKYRMVYATVDTLTLAYVGLLVGILALRLGRDWHARRFRAVRITYPGGQVVTVPAGFSVLEASRWAGIPHASVCGGRGRCSACRVDIVAGGEGLSGPGPDEQRLLTGIGAPPSVRLACQIRPKTDIAVVPLVHSSMEASVPGRALGVLGGSRREASVAALFVDLRQSTQLADDRLPYDTLFIVERYIAAVSSAVRDCRGSVTNIAGDGIMSVFGVRGTAGSGVRDAFAASLLLWDRVDALNRDLGDEISQPLRFGIGLHVGLAVVAANWDGGPEGMPFLGDTGNVAARLEAETKRLDCTMVVSRDAVSLVASGDQLPDFTSVTLPGKQEPVAVVAFKTSGQVRGLLGERVAA